MEADGSVFGTQSFTGAFKLGGVDIKGDKFAGRANVLEKFGSVAAIAEGAVDDNFAWGGFQAGHNFIEQDGYMAAGRGFAFGPEVLLDFGVGVEVVLLVFLLVGFGVSAGVSGPPLVLWRRFVIIIIILFFKYVHIEFFTKKAQNLHVVC